ncbi:hypothetical protein JKP88DRAFT_202661 [Tribonema minus]|uniref:Rubisco LSMT substrate-binding domain-containing protein n=1 Tax=Tribonema minus TaxID=303371 RepID=A0A835YN95_9STRA|nr:hypothetical protein JKP88DRAFT_202661 [Tribonema minus]
MGRYAQLALLAVLVSYCSSCSGWLFNKKERRFLRWLKNNGAVLADGISIDKVEWGRGVLTSKPLKAKDTLLTLPEHLIISAQAIVSSDRLTEEEIDVFKGLRYDGAIITTFLVREKALGKASFWHPYLDLLPDAIPRPANWSADELELLEDAAIQIDAMSDQQRLQQAHAVSLPALDRLLQALPASLRKRAAPVMHSFETYAWADGIVQSRALTFQGQRRLIPFSDFLNYAPHHQARPYSNGAFFLEHHLLFWQGSAMTATVLVDRDTPAGSQVFEDYGDNPNVIYLLYHGFVPAQRNPFDCVSMELRRPTAHASDNRNLEQLRHQLLNKLRLSSSPTLCVTADAASWANARVWHALAVVSMDEAQVRACRATLDGRSCAGLGSFFSEAERSAVVAAAVERRLSEYSTSLQEDERMLAKRKRASEGGRLSANALTAVAYRRWQKVLLQDITTTLSRSRESIDGSAASDSASSAAAQEAQETAAAAAADAASTAPPDIAVDASSSDAGGDGRSELQARVDAFNAWVQEAVGCGVNKLRVQVIDGYRIGAVATEPIAAEEVYLTVPLSAVMNAATAAAHPVLGPVIASLQEQPQWSDPDALMLQLMHERFVAREASAFWPYLALLPTLEEYSVPLTYSDAEVELLRGSDMHAAVVRYRAEVHAAFDRLYGAGGLAAAPETAFVTRERYLWAEAVTSSRAIWWNHKRNMVPLLDAVNCGQGPPGSRPHATRLDESGRFAVTAAAWAFDAGEQVLENYGQPNHIYLQYHGFVIKDNRMDCVRVLDFSPPPDASRETIMRVRRIFSRTPNACVNPYSVPMEFAGWLRIMAGLPYPPRGGISWGSVLDAAGLQAVVDWAQARIGKYDMAVFQSSAAAQTSNGRVVREFIESEVDLLMGMVARFGKMLEARRAEEAKRLEAEARLQAAHSEGGTPGATGMGAGAVAA